MVLWFVGGLRLLNGVYFLRIYLVIGEFLDLLVNVMVYFVFEVKWVFFVINMIFSRIILSCVL